MADSSHNLRLAAAALGVAVLGGLVAVALYSAVGPSSTTTVFGASGSGSDMSVGQIYQQTYKGVVNIRVTEQQPTAAQGGGIGSEATVTGIGTGWVYDTEGDIVTNNHVIVDTKSITVELWDHQTFAAVVVEADPASDLAVIHVNAPSSLLHPLTIVDSTPVRVGDPVVAMGSPFGLQGSVSTGVVSALAREISPNGVTISGVIQLDAAINPGSSGGPLLNSSAEVIGINTQTQNRGGIADGVSFAIPSATMISVLPTLAKGQAFPHPYLGTTVEDSAVPLGAYVSAVAPDSPAAQAKLQVGDGITKVDDVTVLTADDLNVAIAAHKPGDKVTLTYVRGDGSQAKTHTVDVTLALLTLNQVTPGAETTQ